MKVALDVMGGDHGCGEVIAGAKMALAADARIETLFLVGRESEIRAAVSKEGLPESRVSIVDAREIITMEDKPATVIRRKKDSSLIRAVELVKERKADAVISTGNTGALLAASKIKLRMLPGVERPALATVMPSSRAQFILLDVGANPECQPIHLLQFALMGNVYSQHILACSSPRVGILSNGTEEMKGNDLTREAARLCRMSHLNFIGYVEGHDLFSDRVDVVVTDGFIGNLVLKACESLGKSVVTLLKREFTANPWTKLGAWISRNAFRNVRDRLDPDSYGGAPLLGLNGNVIKAHGSSNAHAIRHAIRVSAQSVACHINQVIQEQVALADEILKSSAQEDPIDLVSA